MNDFFRNWLDRLAAACGYYPAADRAIAKRVAATRGNSLAEPALAADLPEAAGPRQERAATKRAIPADAMHYFASFSYVGGFGSIEFYRSRPITNSDDIEAIKTRISDAMRKEGVPNPSIVILQWQRFEHAPEGGAREPIPSADGSDGPADNVVAFRRIG